MPQPLRNSPAGTLAGRVYLWALGAIFATTADMTAIRFREDIHLLVINR